jgi:hypothetical protein
MITLNSQMAVFFELRESVKLPENLKILLSQGFYDKHGAVVLSAFKNLIHIKSINYKGMVSMHSDLTGYEAFANKFYIEDYLDWNVTNFQDILNFGFSAIIELQKNWNKTRTDECEITLSADLESEWGYNASITIYKKRINENLIKDVRCFKQPLLICGNNDHFE